MLYLSMQGDDESGFGRKSKKYNSSIRRFYRRRGVAMTEIARGKQISSPSYLIQSWMRNNTTIEYLRMWEKIYNPQFQEVACNELMHTVHTTGTTLTPSLWINTTRALGMRTSRGKGGGTIAHPEIAEMFRAWLFPEFMLELVQWYRMFQH